METNPPVETKRRSNLLAPQQGWDVRTKDVLKLFGLWFLIEGIGWALYPSRLPEENAMLFSPVAGLLLLYAYRHFDFWPRFADFGLTQAGVRRGWKAGVLWGVVIKVISVAVGFILDTVLRPWSDWARISHPTPVYFWGWLAFAINVIIFAPLIEELIFRGILCNTIKHKHGRIWAIGVTSLIFTLFHGINPVMFGQILVAGIAFALLYEREQNLVTAIMAHATFNLIATVARLL